MSSFEQASGERRAPLTGVRVLELSHAAAAMTGRILSDLGAEVVKIEPEGGEAGRLVEPAATMHDGSRMSFFWLAYNVGKKSVCIDMTTPEGQTQFVELAASSDIVITDFERLDIHESDALFKRAMAANPALIWTDILPFGRGGVFESYPAGDLSLQALGGHLALNGDRDRPPVRIGLPVAILNGGSEAASATLMAYYHRLNTNEGQRVDVSIQACVVWTLLNSTMTWQLLGDNEERGGAVKKERANKFYTRLVWECADGHIFFGPVGGGLGVVRAKSYAALVKWMAEDGFNDALLTSKDWTGADAFRISQAEYDAVSDLIGAFIRHKTTAELMARAVRDGILLAPISSIPQILANPHLRARSYFAKLEDPPRNLNLEYPACWACFDKSPIVRPGPAPFPGQHNEILLRLVGRPAPIGKTNASARKGIFSGLKVVDFSWAAAGPIATKQLSDNGATLVKIESLKHPDSVRLGGPFKDDTPGVNRSGFFADFNSSKLSLSVDMTHNRVAEIIEPLLKWGDVLAVSFRPGVMERWGFGYDRLRQINPRLIMINSSLYGLSGPWHAHPGFGAQGQAIAGFNGQTGWPDRPPASPKGAYTDSVSARYIATALAAALIHRERTGEGQFIEISQIEAGLQFLAPQLIQYQMTSVAAARNGNVDERAILHGVFACRGDDRWIAIEVWTEAQWSACIEVLGAPADLESRTSDRQQLETAVAERTVRRDGFELMAALRHVGVPCGMALRASDLFDDECLRGRGHFWPLEHTEMGRLDYNGPAYRFEKTPTELRSAAPLLGADTDFVLSEILNFDHAKIDELREARLLV